MVAQLALLNPRKRKRKAPGVKKRRRKMTAKQLKFFGPRKGKKSKKAKRAKSQVIIVESNPKRARAVAKKKHRRRRKAKVFTHNPRTKRRRMRRNPRSEAAGFFRNTLVPAGIGAGGALISDYLLNYLPLPAAFTTGWARPVLRIAASLAVGYAVGAVAGREAGEEAAAGGVIVTLYGVAKGYGMGAGAGAAPGMSRYVPMQRYVAMRGNPPGMFFRGPGAPHQQRALGYMNPARVGGPQISRAAMRSLGN